MSLANTPPHVPCMTRNLQQTYVGGVGGNKISLPRLIIVVPCFNEEECLPKTNCQLCLLLDRMKNSGLIGRQSSILYVDDGSSDNTWSLVEKFSKENSYIEGIKLSANKGHQIALWCGLMNAKGDAVVSIDADLQDDINAIPKMLQKYKEGYDIILGIRKRRSIDSFFKRFTAENYYRLLKLLGVNVIFNHADFRLLSHRVIRELSRYKEVNLFLRGLIPLMGFKSSTVVYDRQERLAGVSKYTLSKMLSLAWEGITSFSIIPLRVVSFLGMSIFSISILLSFWALYKFLMTDGVVPGWTSVVISLFFLGGLQLLCLGVIGEYISKIYLESKGRPLFHIEQKTEKRHEE